MKEYQTKKEMIYQILKEEIFEGKFEFGEKLVISHLSKRFNSSEIPVREALNQLNSDSLIVFKPHVGAVVSTLSSKDIQEIFELRVELEGLATRLAVEQFDEQKLIEVREILDASSLAFEEKDYNKFEKLNTDFHMKIYSYCDNKLLIKTIKDLWSNTNRYPSLFKKNDEHIRQSMEEHKDIYTAILNKDSLLAENYMLKHKARAGKEMLRLTQQDFYKNLDRLFSNHTKKLQKK
ncbi:GntR family transcriptional regulator [Virgibacillus sp. NKC19-16]|uniref:GntR family transcriptional regulator n=1 Tax=Virgibacillus salidurans TaxID=2831673 RepID=UPI001F381EEB|nr:GntR family transcriptional regulator [Virgibacillus sp. NKC19-16]UJL45797.1 GntR family transcriptional regulator [Virgibacillus sp. NKC19-16]